METLVLFWVYFGSNDGGGSGRKRTKENTLWIEQACEGSVHFFQRLLLPPKGLPGNWGSVSIECLCRKTLVGARRVLL